MNEHCLRTTKETTVKYIVEWKIKDEWRRSSIEHETYDEANEYGCGAEKPIGCRFRIAEVTTTTTTVTRRDFFDCNKETSDE